jgi:Uma2 family endonuclease
MATLNVHRKLEDRRATLPGAPGEPPRFAFTADDLLALQEAGLVDPDESIEVIDGEMYVMQAKYVSHERWKTRLSTWFTRRLPEPYEVLSEVTLRWGRDLLDPDLALAKRSVLDGQATGIAAPNPADIGLVIEIATSTATYDLGKKARAYARAGIGEYRVIETERNTLTIHRDPRGDAFGSVETTPTSATVAPLAFPDLVLRPIDAIG